MVLSDLATSVSSFFHLLLLLFRSRLSMQLEVLALRHQLTVYRRSGVRPRLKPGDRLLWAGLSRVWSGWQNALVFVQPATVVRLQRRRFAEHWARLSRGRRPGRPSVALELRALIRRMSQANPTWGAPRIVGELGKLGVVVAESTVHKYMVRHRDRKSVV